MESESPRLTHFICLPLRSTDFLNEVDKFNESLPVTINPNIIQPIKSLHFTVGVLTLNNPEDLDSAINFLHSCRFDVNSIVQGRQMMVSFKGIKTMQENLKEVSVLYAVPEEGDGRLRQLCNLLKSKFREANYLWNDKYASQDVLLHCTLLKTRLMKPPPTEGHAAVIDATEIFESKKEYNFGEAEVEEVQICEMKVKDVNGEMRYKSVGGFNLISMENLSPDVVGS